MSQYPFPAVQSEREAESIAGLDIVDGQGNITRAVVFGGEGLTQIGGEGGNAALARQVVADERNAVDT